MAIYSNNIFNYRQQVMAYNVEGKIVSISKLCAVLTVQKGSYTKGIIPFV